MHLVTVGRFVVTSELFFLDREIFEKGKDPVIANDYRQELFVCRDIPHRGFAKATVLPYWGYTCALTGEHELIVHKFDAAGFEPGVGGVYDKACRGCAWLTGEAALPCAVNPFAYGEGCFDYEAK